MIYQASYARYDTMTYRRVGNSGLKLPLISLGLWHNFGESTPLEQQREMLRTAFDLGITHFDLANNYGTPYGSAEKNFGTIFRQDFRCYRDELIISTKAGFDMWPGPYGQGGSSRKYLLASLEQSLQRLGLDYVDIFYSHRFDPDTSLEETAGALASAVTQGKALYIGISSYSPSQTIEISRLLKEWKVPLLIHQPAYNMLNRWIEPQLLNVCEKAGVGIITFSALAQGVLTGKYNRLSTENIPIKAERATIEADDLSELNLKRVSALGEIALKRGQTLAQLSLAWVLRDFRVTSTLIGASSCGQIIENVKALDNLAFSSEELADIDHYAIDGAIRFGRQSSDNGEQVLCSRY